MWRFIVSVLTVGSVGFVAVRLLREHSVEEIAPVVLRVLALSLAWWWVHIGIHEGAHWLVSRLVGFRVVDVQWGPVAFSLEDRKFSLKSNVLSGGVVSLPAGPSLVGPRLKRVALAGPYATAMFTALIFVMVPKPVNHSIEWMVGLAMGSVMLVSAILPGNVEKGFSDFQLWRLSPTVFGHWLYTCALNRGMRGQPLLEISLSELDTVHTSHSSDPQPIDIIWVVRSITEGQTLAAMKWLAQARAFTGEIPQWLRADMAMQHGVLLALEGSLPEAQQCLQEVRTFAAIDWYPLILEACIATAAGRLDDADRLFAEWKSHVAEHKLKHLLMAGNAWLVDALQARLTNR